MKLQIRDPQRSDAQALVDLFSKLDSETSFMLFEPGERMTTVDAQKERIFEFNEAENRQMFVACHGEYVVGVIVGNGGGMSRNQHSVQIAIGVEKAFSGLGVGFQLMQGIESWAQAKQLHRMELTVMTHNSAAIALYEKCGFQQEGRKRHSLKVNGDYVDELLMAKLLTA